MFPLVGFPLISDYVHWHVLTDSFYNSSDDPAACKKLLEKVGLEGYQVIVSSLLLQLVG